MNHSTDIALSVVMPVYNASQHLAKAIESILEQSLEDFELILINDGSTDNSEQIILSYKDPRIVYIKNEGNIGLVNTLNKALERCNGKYIARMDADDISMQNRFSLQVDFLKSNPEFALVCSVAEIIDNEGNALGSWSTDVSATTEEDLYAMLAKTNCIVHPSVMVRADVIKRLRYRKEKYAAEDYDLWLRMKAAGYRLAKIPTTLIRYRIHPSSIMAGSKTTMDTNLRVARQKMFFVRYAIAHGLINRFLFAVLYSTLRSFAAYLRSSIYRIAKWLRYLITLSPVRVSHEYRRMKYALMNFDPEVVFFFPYTHMGGAERVHADIVHAFSNRRCLVVFTGFSKNAAFLKRFESENVLVLVIPHALYSPFTARASKNLLLSKINSGADIKLFGSNSEYYLKLLAEVNQAVFCADLIHAFKFQPGANLAHTKLLPYAQRLNKRVFISHSAMQDFSHFLRANLYGSDFIKRLVYIGNATDLPTNLPAKHDAIKILFAGRNSPEKRVHLFFELAKRFVNRANVRFELAGAKLKVGLSNFTTYGELDQQEMDRLYAEAHILVLTSSREGFPMVIMEAMAMGVVPVCTPVGDIPFHINGSNGVLLKDTIDEAAIVNELELVIADLLNDRKKLSTMSEQAYDYAKHHFKRSDFEESYRSLLNT